MNNKLEKSKQKINKILNWGIYLIGYTIVLMLVSLIFKKTIYIDSGYFGIWALIASFIIYLLNRTIKPLIIWLTLPITALTLGLFYPFINVLILKITDLILTTHFDIRGIIMSFIVAIMISLMNIVLDIFLINPIIRKER